ncbi:LysR family transcriptional regulator [Burkholderia thailandensis]|uniref:LysR family transcriptional regulator n=1 Tax=Burkholderia thailandensis (strain ATCC 700388 / DSM 13276 / CCUG 48851 / CIP 106301 / E264) TaxID=271848 RepID=Q2T0E4_BURTA|nr:LysR family transcriptional regulator [Burkholderia thailandensis]ABC37198.1 LysR family transcriptional regulator [Burkholderia thailandensis E264]AHI71990.1 bacterial regulatory helix-turn-helix, lysR family protein [Burkholderia thailandensis 2002721723]AIP25222.1 bacterial regulatory helix-turn-helix, lysR family protein [Burkholderia thailandensis E264]AIS93946.1 bacterial regulatory helix-turn-helix, lysR family protein [Burkholderia thailandensis MSMB59]AIT20511.1 bacterial regulator
MREVNRFSEMAVFVQVIESCGFSAAGRRLDMTPSAISKFVQRLETRLGVRLLNRTTRKLQLTPEGAAFYERCVRILEDIADAEREATHGAIPQGRVRINSHVPFGKHHLMPLVPEFQRRYPDITLDIVLSDAAAGPLDDRSDIAIRSGSLDDSRLVMRRLGGSRMIVVGSPAYLELNGMPATPDDLDRHNCIGLSGNAKAWPFAATEGQRLLQWGGNLLLGDNESIREAAVSGLGLARLARFHVDADLDAGRLVPVLEAFNPGDEEEINAVFVGPSEHLPMRVHALLEFLKERIRIGPRAAGDRSDAPMLGARAVVTRLR